MDLLNHRTFGNGPAVLLLHPVGLDQTFWGNLPDDRSKDYTLVAVDLLGHGGSPAAQRPGLTPVYCEGVAALIETLGLRPATLVGVSFGGMIAQTVACDRPDLVSGLALVAWPAVMPTEARAAILQRGKDAEQGGMGAVLEATLTRWFTPNAPNSLVERVRTRLIANAPTNWSDALT